MSKQRNLRKSKLSFADEEDEEDVDKGSLALPPAAVKAAQQQKQKEKKAPNKLTLLSFDDDTQEIGDGADEGFVAIKRKGGKGGGTSRRQIAPAPVSGIPSAPPSTYTQVAAAGEYTAEKLKQLQKATLRAPRSVSAKADKGSGFSAAAVGAAMPLPPPPLPPSAAGGARRFAHPVARPGIMLDGDDALGVDEEDGGPPSATGFLVPDSAAIKAAKAQRERLRAVHAAPDYIPIGATGGVEEGMEFGGARLKELTQKRWETKEEDEAAVVGTLHADEADSDREIEPEDKIRLRFGGAGKNDKKMLDLDQPGSEDEEEAAWADEQIRKGVQSGGSLRVAKTKKDRTATAAAGGVGARGASGVGFLPPSQGAAVAAAADEVVAALHAALQRAQLSQRQAEKNLARTERSLEDCIANIARMEDELKSSGEKYVFIQQLRAYVSDLCSMLAEKSPLVEELQEELQRAQEERASAHSRRCRDEQYESRVPCEAAVAAAVRALSNGATAEDAQGAAAAAADASEKDISAGGHIPEELDEFGRDANAHRRAKIAERRVRRAAQDAAKAAATEAELLTLGDLTTSESDDEVETYKRRKGEVLDAAAVIFRDASDEFGSLGAVKSRLEQWKRQYIGQYNDAYMSESVPALFAPFVRAELLSWTPLDQATATPSGDGANREGPGGLPYAGFDLQEWYKLLFDYGMPPDNGAPLPGDADVDLLPRLVKALVVPRVLAAVQRVWNPLSARQSTAVAGMLGELMVYLDPENEALVGLVGAILRRVEEVQAAVMVPSWPPAALAASRRAELHFMRCFGRALRLMRSICAFSGVLPAARLQELAVQQVAARQLLPAVRAAAADPLVLAKRAQRVLDALPAAWTQSGVPRGLEGLSDVVQAALRALEPAAGTEQRRTAAAPAAAALAGVVAKLGDAAGARRLQLMFDIA